MILKQMYNFYMILKQMLNYYMILIEMKPLISTSNVFSSVMKSIVMTVVR